jgi:hypothetical protein
MKKNAITFNLFLTAVILLLLSGCQKSLTDNQSDSLLGTASKRSTLTPLLTTDIYVAGSDNDTAVYWKNGVETKLSGVGTGSMATGIVAIGTNVYVCGYGPSPTTGNLVAEYWLNGVLTSLSDGTQFVMASGIAVSGSNVYVCGYAPFSTSAWVWKNGVATSLPSGEPTGIAVDANGNVYISNDISSSVSPAGPNYYRNDTLERLSGGIGAYTLAMATLGTNFYTVGADETETGDSALLWANGSPGYLLQSYTYQQAMAVTAATISGTTFVYTSGIVGNDENDMHIAYWNNSGDDYLLGAGEFVAGSTGVAVDESNNAYVCGTQITINPGAWLWTIADGGPPGTPTQLGSANAIALAVTVGQ